MTEEKYPYTPAPEDKEFKSDPPTSGWQSNIPALVGFLILAVVVVWGLAHLVSLARPWVQSVFLRPATPTTRTAQPTNMPTPVMTQVAAPSTREAPSASGTHQSRTYAPASPAAPADLVAHILAVGVIDPMTGEFVNRHPVSPNDMAAVQFDIANDGGASTGVWHFDAQLPTGYSYLYTSPAQIPLGPGDHIVNTLRFTQVAPGGGEFRVIVDSQGEVRESNKANNTDHVFVAMPVYY